MDHEQTSDALASIATKKLNAEAPAFVPRSVAPQQRVYAAPPPFLPPFPPPPYNGYNTYLQQNTAPFYGYGVNQSSPVESAPDHSNGNIASPKNGQSDAHEKVLNQKLMENMLRSEEENESSGQAKEVVLEEEEDEEEYVLLDLDRVSPHLQIPPNAPYVLSGLDTPNPIFIIDGKIKLIGKYEETMGTCLIFNEHDAAPAIYEETGPSEANLFAGRYIVDPLRKPSKIVNPVARLHKVLKFKPLLEADCKDGLDERGNEPS